MLSKLKIKNYLFDETFLTDGDKVVVSVQLRKIALQQRVQQWNDCIGLCPKLCSGSGTKAPKTCRLVHHLLFPAAGIYAHLLQLQAWPARSASPNFRWAILQNSIILLEVTGSQSAFLFCATVVTLCVSEEVTIGVLRSVPFSRSIDLMFSCLISGIWSFMLHPRLSFIKFTFRATLRNSNEINAVLLKSWNLKSSKSIQITFSRFCHLVLNHRHLLTVDTAILPHCCKSVNC